MAADIKVEQVVTDGSHNVIVLKIKENSGREIYATLPAYNNLWTAIDAARVQVRGF